MRRISIISVVLLMLVATAVASGGCGGGSSSNASGTTGNAEETIATTAHSKAEFVKLANGICNHERQKLVDEVITYMKEHQGEGKSEEQLINKATAKILLPAVQQQIEEIRQLGAPKGDEKKIEDLLSALQEAVDDAPHFDMNDFDHASDLANAYHLEYCSFSK